MWTAAYDYTRSSGPTVNCRTVAIRHKTADYGYTRRRGTFFELDLFFIGSFIPGTLFDSGLQSVNFSNFHFFPWYRVLILVKIRNISNYVRYKAGRHAKNPWPEFFLLAVYGWPRRKSRQ